MIEQMHDDKDLKSIPVIVVSTEGSATRIEQLKTKGVCAYIRKPFTPERIREVVDEVLGADHGGD
jgi:two-component system chemotaxis response regulator CheY